MIVIDTSGYTLLALLCVLIHECGHIFMLVRFKVPVEKISLRLFGIEIVTGSTIKLSAKKELIIALSGCFANLLTIIVCEILEFFSVFKDQFSIMSLFSVLIGGMNLLPIGSLDGSSVLEIFLLRRLTPDKVNLIINITSVVFLIPLACLGILILFKEPFNISLIAVAAYLTSFLFIKNEISIIPHITKRRRD